MHLPFHSHCGGQGKPLYFRHVVSSFCFFFIAYSQWSKIWLQSITHYVMISLFGDEFTAFLGDNFTVTSSL